VDYTGSCCAADEISPIWGRSYREFARRLRTSPLARRNAKFEFAFIRRPYGLKRTTGGRLPADFARRSRRSPA